ncbi:response regulator transcription factor [Propionivibrio limicola]|uniref:response regulator transcription factor n=1 Tax=Propionivibrio limicola TaxID=167645 RepID=UPI001290970D|nr:response regulator [Propionivibrio limicola]
MNNKESSRTVYVVDDDPTMRKLLKVMVATIGIDAQTFGLAREFLSAYRPMPCECLLCDIRMPEIDGMELQRLLATMNATLPIIFLTGFAEVQMAVEAMKLGAFDFIEKPFSAQALLGKIQSALEASRVLHAERLKNEAVNARKELLTPRERSVVEQVVDGKSSREISELLGLSVRTVENHRTRIMEKLHVDSTVDLIKLFL